MSLFQRIRKLRGKVNDRKSHVKLIEGSEYFDATYYLKSNPDVAVAGVNPADHFIRFGGFEGRKPSAKFDPAFYLSSYEDVARSGLNPLVHYLTHGIHEGRGSLPIGHVGTNVSSAKKAPKAVVRMDANGRSGDHSFKLLQLNFLQAAYAGFDWILGQLVDQEVVQDLSFREQLQSIQCARWLAEGDASSSERWLDANEGHPYSWYYRALVSKLKGDLEGAFLAAQTFSYQRPRVAEGVYLLSDIAIGQGKPEVAHAALRQFAAGSRRARTWWQLARLVSTPGELQDYLRALENWCTEAPNARHHPDIVSATARACGRAGNLLLAKQAFKDAIVFHRARKNGFRRLRQSTFRFSQHINLPLWATPFENLPSEQAMDTQSRMKDALRDLYGALDQVNDKPFLVQQTLDVCLGNAESFSLDQPLTLGLPPRAAVESVSLKLQRSHYFYSHNIVGNQVEIKHQNGISILIFRHQEQAESWSYETKGVSWECPPVRVIAHDWNGNTVYVPEGANEYQALYGESKDANWDWVIQSRNRTIVNKDEYAIYCCARLLTALIAEDKSSEVLCVRELAAVEDAPDYQRLVGGVFKVPTAQDIQKDGVRVVLYVSGLENVGYQANMWIPVLERLSVNAAIVIRERRIANELKSFVRKIFLRYLVMPLTQRY